VIGLSLLPYDAGWRNGHARAMLAIERTAVIVVCIAFSIILLAFAPALADEPARYIGSAACAGCHASETALWKMSHHAMAMQPATPTSVLGDFNDSNFVNGKITTTFHRSGNTYMVRTDGPDGALHDFPIAYTFGVAPLQQYLIALPGGRYQALGIAWDSRLKDAGGQRWYSLYPGQSLTAGDRLHWTGRDQTWNYMCADCHSTDVKKNYDLATDSYATTFAEIDVGCEACHGPASRHVAWAADRSKLSDDPHEGLVAWLRTKNNGVWAMNEATGIAQRTEPRTSAAELETCAGCHARAATIAPAKDAATPFLDAHLPALLEPGYYHADGQIDGEVFEYGSFLQSRMYHAGVTCTDCHEPHTQKLRAEGNELCAQCHMPAKFDVASHYHHEPGSAGAQCANCHMPTKTYMGVDVRHDHSIRVPRPDLSVKLGTPNACTNCHTGQKAAWAASTIAGWFPNGRQTRPQYGEALAAGGGGGVGAEPVIDALIGNATEPGIVRASALLLLSHLGSDASLPAWRAALADPDPIVRLGAVRALPAAPSAAIQKDVATRLTDPVRAVRTEAARALAGVDPQILAAEQRAALSAALLELVAGETVSADRPETHLNLGLLDLRQRQLDQADAEYRTALRLDPKFVPAMVNLADLDRVRGLDQQGAEMLRKAVELEPGNADAHYALGLLLVRQHTYPAALAELRRTTELAPDNTRFVYTYAIALNSTGSHDEALALLRRAHTNFPASMDLLSALLSLSRDDGDVVSALQYARELWRLHPGDVQLALLIRDLERQQPH
jgi:predicted CXXCH cytochrome family protein